MTISEMSKLSFFKIGKYQYLHNNICDFSNCPRPHYCMGLIIKGEGVFSSESGADVKVSAGDIIFVPITSRYISRWKGNPDILYISMHFAFEPSANFLEKKDIRIQKITLPDFDTLQKDFCYALENYDADEASRFSALSIFYKVMGQIIPKLSTKEASHMDKRIERAIEYINLNSTMDISMVNLANLCDMSESHFYACFKKATGVTPVEYKNNICINRAMRLLLSDENISIEHISEMLGFYSSAYFRRLFKKITGQSPSKYRKTSIEL